MMRLLLMSNSTAFGGGYLDHGEAEIRQTLDGVRTVLFVPYALHDQDGYAAKVRARLQAMGLELVSIHELPDPVEAVTRAEAIFVGGGNTFRLLDGSTGRRSSSRFDSGSPPACPTSARAPAPTWRALPS